MIIQAGTTLTLETGEYSDFTCIGPFLVLRTIDQQQLLSIFRENNPPVFKPNKYYSTEYNGMKGYWSEPNTDDFIVWLTYQGYIEDIKNKISWWLGDGKLNPEIQ